MTLARITPYLGDGPRVAQLPLGADVRATVPPVPIDSPDDLYGLPLERFVEERTALVKALRMRNESEEAKRVNGLRKPTVAAWAVNQLVRSQPKTIRALFDSGDDLASAVAADALSEREALSVDERRRRQRSHQSQGRRCGRDPRGGTRTKALARVFTCDSRARPGLSNRPRG